jgi:hypothetical protein
MHDEDYILTIAVMSVLYEYRDRLYMEYMNTELTKEIAFKIVDTSMKFAHTTERIVEGYERNSD